MVFADRATSREFLAGVISTSRGTHPHTVGRRSCIPGNDRGRARRIAQHTSDRLPRTDGKFLQRSGCRDSGLRYRDCRDQCIPGSSEDSRYLMRSDPSHTDSVRRQRHTPDRLGYNLERWWMSGSFSDSFELSSASSVVDQSRCGSPDDGVVFCS